MFSSSVSPFAGPSRLSSLIGVSVEKSNSVPAASSDAIEAEARRETPAVFLESPPAVYTVYHDQQGVAHSLEGHRLSCDTFSVPPPYSPESYIGTTTEKHTEVSSDKEPPTLARMLFMYGFCKFLKVHLTYIMLIIVNTSILPILASGNLHLAFTAAPYT